MKYKTFQINKIELLPFKYLIDNGVKGAMVGHLYFPALEPVVNKSSSLSKNIVTDLLRDEMNYDGIPFVSPEPSSVSSRRTSLS